MPNRKSGQICILRISANSLLKLEDVATAKQTTRGVMKGRSNALLSRRHYLRYCPVTQLYWPQLSKTTYLKQRWKYADCINQNNLDCLIVTVS
jgi:hypothetical protein